MDAGPTRPLDPALRPTWQSVRARHRTKGFPLIWWNIPRNAGEQIALASSVDGQPEVAAWVGGAARATGACRLRKPGGSSCRGAQGKLHRFVSQEGRVDVRSDRRPKIAPAGSGSKYLPWLQNKHVRRTGEREFEISVLPRSDVMNCPCALPPTCLSLAARPCGDSKPSPAAVVLPALHGLWKVPRSAGGHPSSDDLRADRGVCSRTPERARDGRLHVITCFLVLTRVPRNGVQSGWLVCFKFHGNQKRHVR
jgi:hypothetical protein